MKRDSGGVDFMFPAEPTGLHLSCEGIGMMKGHLYNVGLEMKISWGSFYEGRGSAWSIHWVEEKKGVIESSMEQEVMNYYS